jgi:hypothetical protein
MGPAIFSQRECRALNERQPPDHDGRASGRAGGPGGLSRPLPSWCGGTSRGSCAWPRVSCAAGANGRISPRRPSS